VSASIRIGPAGWLYKDWQGNVYPKRRPRGFEPLEYLAHFVDVVEVNASFYRPFTAANARSWMERVRHNDRFRFTAKLYQRFTHERTPWTAEELRQAREAFDTLAEGGALGAVLLQFPWSFKRNDANQEWLRELSRALQPLPLVVEVRHDSWEAASDWLGEHGLGLANIDQPLLYDKSLRPAARATGAVGYVRLHGRNYQTWGRGGKRKGDDEPKPIRSSGDARYDYLYTPGELRPWADAVQSLARAPQVREVYAVTNNHPRGQAMVNALELEAMIEGTLVDCPPSLFEAYPAALENVARPAADPE
jgi:uncharacterized protein YecE (DUF72 family)